MKHNLKILLNTLENDNIEFKESLSLWKEIIETVSAFSNHKGGIILIGVKDNGSIIGLTIGKSTIEDITNKIKLNTEPTILPIITWQEIDNKTIIIIEVQEAKLKPVRVFGKSYKRVGKTNQIMSLLEESYVLLDSMGQTWDGITREDATLDDIDDDKIRKFLIKAKKLRNWDVDLDIPKKEILEKLDLIRDNKLTIASLLLFAERPQKFLLQAEISAVYFKGKKKTDLIVDFERISGDIIEQVDKAMRFIKRNMKISVSINGSIEREETWEYPIDAIREAIINAICHRDYASPSKVQIEIYDDRIEISNPGKLLSGLTIEQLKKPHKSIARNKLIANIFFRIKYIEELGSGILEMIKILLENGFPEPEFIENGNFFEVIIRKPSEKHIFNWKESKVTKEFIEKRKKQIGNLLNTLYDIRTDIEKQLIIVSDSQTRLELELVLKNANTDIVKYEKEFKELANNGF